MTNSLPAPTDGGPAESPRRHQPTSSSTDPHVRCLQYAGVVGAVHYWAIDAADRTADERLQRIVDLLRDFAATQAGAALLGEPNAVTVTSTVPAAGGGAR